jgi:hypothetical protein
VALTPLRPSGTADIDGERVDVVAEGDFVEKGDKIQPNCKLRKFAGLPKSSQVSP